MPQTTTLYEQLKSEQWFAAHPTNGHPLPCAIAPFPAAWPDPRKNGAGRDQQLAERGVVAPNGNEQAQAIDRKLTLAGAATALTFGGAFGYPLLGLLSVPILLYLGYGMIVGGVRQLRNERRIGATVLDAVICSAVLVMRFFSLVQFSSFSIT